MTDIVLRWTHTTRKGRLRDSLENRTLNFSQTFGLKNRFYLFQNHGNYSSHGSSQPATFGILNSISDVTPIFNQKKKKTLTMLSENAPDSSSEMNRPSCGQQDLTPKSTSLTVQLILRALIRALRASLKEDHRLDPAFLQDYSQTSQRFNQSLKSQLQL